MTSKKQDEVADSPQIIQCAIINVNLQIFSIISNRIKFPQLLILSTRKNLHLGVSDEGDADGELPLHPARQGLGSSVALVLQVQDANDAVHLAGDLFLAVTFQLDVQTRSSRQTERSLSLALCVRRRCEHLCEEEQVLPDGEVVEQDVVLRTEAQAAADQSHILTDVIAVDVSPAAGGREQPCVEEHKLKAAEAATGCVLCSSCAAVTCQHGQRGGLSSPVVSEQHSDLSLEHVHGEIVHGQPHLAAHFEFLMIRMTHAHAQVYPPGPPASIPLLVYCEGRGVRTRLSQVFNLDPGDQSSWLLLNEFAPHGFFGLLLRLLLHQSHARAAAPVGRLIGAEQHSLTKATFYV